ncbi:MAG TPA: 1-acyl-sn-glycerol-3-phosphate acyltransferase, partial [Deltaproteobacteria bacterium]|nr:1-acyl-sn-glycerol-3-phosphate acyltransferase [Deltaproteobacteria bacterium]
KSHLCCSSICCAYYIFMKYIFYVLLAIVLYEILRAALLAWIRGRLYRSVRDYLEKNDIRLDKYKLMHKIAVKQDLLNDSEIHQAIIHHAQEKGMKIQEVQDQVEEYIEEIVPFFNLLSYYKIGYWIANFFLNIIYEVVIDHENAAKLKKIPPESVVVFVMNHRSNIDYILVAYMLAQQISLSYAVGEWARVWPLEHIFKSFGAYFIRRRFREPLYHLVLEKYVQLISLQGVTQGIFLEGGLSRDGNFRSAKIGILDYIIRIKKNPAFEKDLVFVPAAINYDWVLEDRTLMQEWKKGKEKSGFKDHASSFARILIKGPATLGANLARYCTRRLKHHGYASVSFGDPVFLSDFIAQQEEDIFLLDRYDRLSHIQTFADRLLERIGSTIPVTPVCITAHALLSFNGYDLSKTDLIREVSNLRSIIREKGGRIVLGKTFESSVSIHRHLMEEKQDRRQELVTFEEDLLDFEDARHTVDVALDLLRRRKIISLVNEEITISEKRRPFLEYYANSLSMLSLKTTQEKL